MLDKQERMNRLLDFYAALLTEHQQHLMQLHYREDYSYSEIAELQQSSKASIHESIKRSETILEDVESKLNCLKQYEKRKELYTKARSIGDNNLNDLIDKLEMSEE